MNQKNMENEMSDELKPCPFCGETFLSISEGHTFRWRRVECPGCLARGPEVRVQTTGEGDKDQWEEKACKEAEEAWDTRAEPEGEVRFILEGNLKQEPGAWRGVFTFNRMNYPFESEDQARQEESRYRNDMANGKTGWLDFRVVKVRTTREVLK